MSPRRLRGAALGALLVLSGLGGAAVAAAPSTAATTFTVTASPDPVPAGVTSVTLTATISPAPAAGSAVQFEANGTPLPATAYTGGCSVNGAPAACVDANGNATATYSGFSPGSTNSLVALLGRTSSAPLTLKVGPFGPDSSSTTLSASSTTITADQSTTLTAQVIDETTGLPVTSGGSVQFYDESTTPPTPIGSAVTTADANGNYSLTWGDFSVGTHPIEANFTGPANIASSSGSGLSITVTSANPPPTSTDLALNPRAITTSGSATLVATVTNAVNGAAVSDGVVTFYDENTTPFTLLGTATNVGNGEYSMTVGSLASGTQTIEANFTSENEAPSTGTAAITVLSGLASSSTTLSASASTLYVGQAVTLSGSVTSDAPPGVTPTGSIIFSENGVEIASVPVDANGDASEVWQPPAGSYSLTASYSGDAAIDTSVSDTSSLTVDAVDTTTISTSSSPNAPVIGGAVQLSATVTPTSTTSGTPTGSVSYYLGSVAPANLLCVGTLSGGATSCSTSALPIGTDTIVASYGGDAGHLASQATFSVTVAQDSSSLTATASPPAPVAGASVTLSATVAPGSPTSGAPTGSVSFYLGTVAPANLLCSASLSGATATCATTALPVGSDSVVASYSGDGAHGSSTVSIPVSVAKAASATSATASPSTVLNGGSVTLSATVTGDKPSGTVSFSVGGSVLCTASVGTTGSASCATSALPVGTNEVVTATYSGDANNLASSATTTVTVSAAPPNYNCSSFGGIVGFGWVPNTSGTPRCEPWMLSDPDPALSLNLTQGSAGALSITYGDFTPLGSGANAPTAELETSTGSDLSLLPVTVTPLSSVLGIDRAELSVAIPATLAPGSYAVQLTAFDSAGYVDQYLWTVVVTSVAIPPDYNCGETGLFASGGFGFGGCAPLLSNPSSPRGALSVGSPTTLSITYSSSSPLATGAKAPIAVLTNASGAVAAVLPVSVVAEGSLGGGNRDVLSVTVPGNLAAGTYDLRLTVSAANGAVDQYDWPLVLTSSSAVDGGQWGSGEGSGGWPTLGSLPCGGFGF